MRTTISKIRRAEGKLRNLEEVMRLSPLDGTYGIGHTRWATHGRPTEENAHPHRDCTGRVVVVHNGIIENYLQLKERLRKTDHQFVTETDTEIIAHLIEEYLKQEHNFRKCRAPTRCWNCAASSRFQSSTPTSRTRSSPSRQGPPVVIGLGDGEFSSLRTFRRFCNTRATSFFSATARWRSSTKTPCASQTFEGNSVAAAIQRITWDPIMAEKGGFKHFMLKEIYEQPRSVRDTVQGRISLDTGRVFLDEMKNITEADFKRFTSIKIAACGTSWHAGLAGKYMIEQLARIPVDVDYASEFRYRDPVMDENTLLLVISQSGETADTIAALREAKELGAKVLAICNVQGSMITREADGTILTHAGPEIGVASTKAFTCADDRALFAWSVSGPTARHAYRRKKHRHHAQQLAELPVKTGAPAERIGRHRRTVERVLSRQRIFFTSAAASTFPVALEGALKLKEISYIHAEGYPAGEMKHGPNALIDERLPVMFINTREEGNRSSELRYEKTHSNIVEVKAREGIVISVLTEGDTMSSVVSDHVIEIPAVERSALADSLDHSAATARLSHRRAPRLRRGPAAQSGEVSNGGVARAPRGKTAAARHPPRVPGDCAVLPPASSNAQSGVEKGRPLSCSKSFFFRSQSPAISTQTLIFAHDPMTWYYERHRIGRTPRPTARTAPGLPNALATSPYESVWP